MNIKQLCELYNEPYNSKNPTRSLNNLKKNYLIIEHNKNYTVERPLTEEERSSLSNRSQAKTLLRQIICIELSKSPTNTLRADTKGFLEMFYIVNSKYRFFSYENLNEDKIKILNSTDLTSSMLEYFYKDVHPILSRLLKEVFKELELELLIKKTDIMMYGNIKRIGDDIVTEKHQATPDEVEQFLSVARAIMLSKGIKSWDKAQYFQKKQINHEACKVLGWSFVYNDYLLTLNRQGLQQEASALLLNNEVCKKLYRSKQGHLKEYDKSTLKDCVDFLIKLS